MVILLCLRRRRRRLASILTLSSSIASEGLRLEIWRQDATRQPSREQSRVCENMGKKDRRIFFIFRKGVLTALVLHCNQGSRQWRTREYDYGTALGGTVRVKRDAKRRAPVLDESPAKNEKGFGYHTRETKCTCTSTQSSYQVPASLFSRKGSQVRKFIVDNKYDIFDNPVFTFIQSLENSVLLVWVQRISSLVEHALPPWDRGGGTSQWRMFYMDDFSLHLILPIHPRHKTSGLHSTCASTP